MPLYNVDTTSCSEAIRMAQRSVRKGLYAEAISFYEGSLDAGANDVILLNNLADACLRNGQLDRAESYAMRAVGAAPHEALPEVTLGQILQAQGRHKDAVARVLAAKEKLEALAPELCGIAFDSIEELIEKLPIKAKSELAGKDWIRVIYLVRSLIETYEVELGYVEQGLSWECLEEFRRDSLREAAASHLRFKEKVGISGIGATAVARTVCGVAAISGAEQVKLDGQAAGGCAIRVLTCWRHSVIRSMGVHASPGWVPCSQLCAEKMNCIARAIDPAVGFSFSTTLASGAACCEGVFVTNRRGNATERRQSDAST